jgi:hypothetical protein
MWTFTPPAPAVDPALLPAQFLLATPLRAPVVLLSFLFLFFVSSLYYAYLPEELG